mmetsp:Transcript_6737/g.16579  ORF Transcript_6737/g.16579 Transcript_6737/m.16579 type:complete len:130 (+) Transcript_6737:92-481(+)
MCSNIIISFHPTAIDCAMKTKQYFSSFIISRAQDQSIMFYTPPNLPSNPPKRVLKKYYELPTMVRSTWSKHISASRTRPSYINSCSILIFIPSINDFNCEASFVVMEHAMTGRETPHARPKATLLGTNT